MSSSAFPSPHHLVFSYISAFSHTFGGVAHPPFPDVVPDLNNTSNTQSVAHFDGTRVGFDNSVFASSPAFFASTCASLFAHMLDRAG
ncbi:hypothetical protein B0H14DRAFT_3452745 [Mycena olivaceomarginata]|nr:hypothetical protein B0H14DRAFT_3452745 [Mycena olivaceomarginata]